MIRDWSDWRIEDLRLVPAENSIADNGEEIHCVYSYSRDAVTFVDAKTVAELKLRGISHLERLPS